MDVGKDVLPYAGIPTFLGRGLSRELTSEVDIAVVGIPYDSGVSYRPGARLAPESIRRASMTLRFYTPDSGLLDMGLGETVLRDRVIVDYGDIEVPFGNLREASRRIYGEVKRIIGGDIFIVFLGGDHSITPPIVKAYREKIGDIKLIQFDAHLDLLDKYMGEEYTHASTISRVIDYAGIDPGNIIQIGIRGYTNSPESYNSARRHGLKIYTIDDVINTGIEDVSSEIIDLIGGHETYITFDIDVLDPSEAPGTGLPEPGGFRYIELRRMLKRICRETNIVAMDIVEVSPLLDVNDVTSRLAVYIILDVLSML